MSSLSFRRRLREAEFNEEIDSHIEERTRRNIAQGMAKDEAEAEARRRFGSVERAKSGMRAAHRAGASAVALPLLALAIGCIASLVVYVRVREPIYDVTPEITAPVPLVAPRAEYTTSARHQKIQGTVRLQCIVRRDGSCSDVTVIRSLDRTFGLDDEAARVLREWHFRPGLRHGTPVDTRISLDLRFSLR